jgi:hypothetical protein
MAQISVGATEHEKAMRAIELFGTEVVPTVCRELAADRRTSAGGPAAV